jgi:hypothetical protein
VLLMRVSKGGELLDSLEFEIHIYASAREFVAVPVEADAAGTRVETLPVEHVNLVMGRATLVELARALREMRERRFVGTSIAHWDGDNGRWWAHNLLFVVLRWDAEGLVFERQERASTGNWETAESERLDHGTSFVDLAEKLVGLLGEQLHS